MQKYSCTHLISKDFKRGYRQDCSDYKMVSFLSIPRKVFAHILLKRLWTKDEKFLPEAQRASRANQGTRDMISLWQIQVKFNELNIFPYIIFVDFRKAFNLVNKEAQWNIIRRLQCPDVFVKYVSTLEIEMKASNSFSGELWESIAVGNRMKQGNDLASILFLNFLLSSFIL